MISKIIGAILLIAGGMIAGFCIGHPIGQEDGYTECAIQCSKDIDEIERTCIESMKEIGDECRARMHQLENQLINQINANK